MTTSKAWLAALLAAVPAVAIAQQVNTYKSRESADFHAVYWVSNCRSMLEGFVGIEVISGPPGVTLALRKQDVIAARQRCKDPVPGAIVVATMPAVTQPVSGTLRYQVTYMTRDGKQTSQHSRDITITP